MNAQSLNHLAKVAKCFSVCLRAKSLLVRILLLSLLWRHGVMVVTTSQFHSTKFELWLCRFKSCLWHVRDLQWWGALAMVPAGNKANKHLSLVNHTTNTIHYQFIIIIIIIIIIITWTSDITPVSSKAFLDIQATIECRFTLKRVRDMITYSHAWWLSSDSVNFFSLLLLFYNIHFTIWSSFDILN